MNEGIAFNKVLKDPGSWCDDMDLEIMTDNYLKLKRIINKMKFREYPKHPQIFTLLFSQKDFADKLINAMVSSGINDLGTVWFIEYTKEDAKKLISKGLYALAPAIVIGVTTIVFCRSHQDYHVCVFPEDEPGEEQLFGRILRPFYVLCIKKIDNLNNSLNVRLQNKSLHIIIIMPLLFMSIIMDREEGSFNENTCLSVGNEYYFRIRTL